MTVMRILSYDLICDMCVFTVNLNLVQTRSRNKYDFLFIFCRTVDLKYFYNMTNSLTYFMLLGSEWWKIICNCTFRVTRSYVDYLNSNYSNNICPYINKRKILLRSIFGYLSQNIDIPQLAITRIFTEYILNVASLASLRIFYQTSPYEHDVWKFLQSKQFKFEIYTFLCF